MRGESRRGEIFHWTAILFAFAPGTAAGDCVAEGFKIGYGRAALLSGVLIFLTAAAWHFYGATAVLCFRIAHVLARPFGASCGDFAVLGRVPAHGGLGLDVTATRALLLVMIVRLVIMLTQQGRSRGKQQDGKRGHTVPPCGSVARHAVPYCESCERRPRGADSIHKWCKISLQIIYN